MTQINQPAAPGIGPEGLPTPSIPDINQPAAPGIGPEGLPTPSLPDINQPAAPGIGPEGLPTPSLPSNNRPVCPPGNCTPTPSRRCPDGYKRATVGRNQTFYDLLLENNVSYDAMRSANPNLSTGRPAAGTVYCAPPSGTRRMCTYGSRSYVMGQGETLFTLVRTLNTTAARLLRANPNLAPGDFLPGRVICLP